MKPQLVGGEMPHWSDAAPVGGPLLQALAGTAHGRTLIVGPHAADLIDAVPAEHVTVLVRGLPDAEALAARLTSRPGFEVCCGSLAKLDTVPAYDTVLALDGLDRTASTETADLSWDAGLAVLLAALRPGGRLLLGLSNPVGLDSLLSFPAGHGLPADSGAGVPPADSPWGSPLADSQWGSPPADSQWGVPPADDPTRPPGLAALRDRLRAAGLTVARDYAAYPSAQAPTALLSEATLSDTDLHGFVSAALRRAGLPAGPMLADPRPVAVRLLTPGLATSLAPGWFVQAVRPGAAPDPLPAALIATDQGVHRLNHVADRGWHLSPMPPDPHATPDPAAASGPGAPAPHLPGPAAASRSAGPLSGAPWPIPPSRSLHDLLLAAIRRHDLPELRTLLTTWRAGETAAVPPAEILVTRDGHLHALAAPTDPATALDHLATAVLTETPAEPETLTLLHAMAGAALPPNPPARPDIRTFRELAAAHDRLARELSDAQAQSLWYEQRLATRDAELVRANRIISLLKGTAPGRAATAVRTALRTGRIAARTALTRLRPDA